MAAVARLNRNINIQHIRVQNITNSSATLSASLFSNLYIGVIRIEFTLSNNDDYKNMIHKNKKHDDSENSDYSYAFRNRALDKTSSVKNTKKIVDDYNKLSKKEKLKRLNEINRHYESLSENDKKTFKEKLINTGLAALSGGALTAYGTKMTVSGTAATSVTNAEAMEMTPLLLLSTSTTESLTTVETITVAETAAVEGGVIAGETGTACCRSGSGNSRIILSNWRISNCRNMNVFCFSSSCNI